MLEEFVTRSMKPLLFCTIQYTFMLTLYTCTLAGLATIHGFCDFYISRHNNVKIFYFSIKKSKQVVAELGHTRIPSCQLGQCSDQVEPDGVGMVLVSKRNFLKV